jgi:hypothetical protein
LPRPHKDWFDTNDKAIAILLDNGRKAREAYYNNSTPVKKQEW